MSIDFPKEEEAIIARWREIKAFERQVRIHTTTQRLGRMPNS
jgi:hypothetical protein